MTRTGTFVHAAPHLALLAAVALQLACANVTRVHEVAGLSVDDMPGKRGVVYALPRTVFKVQLKITQTKASRGIYQPSLDADGKPILQFSSGHTITDVDIAKLDAIGKRHPKDKHGYTNKCTTGAPCGADQSLAKGQVLTASGATYFNGEIRITPDEYQKLLDELRKHVPVGKPTEKADRSFKFSDIKVTAEAEPDPDRVYLAETSGDILTNRTLILQLSELGLITALDAKADDQKLDIILGATETAATIAGAVVGFGDPSLATGTGSTLHKIATAVISEIATRSGDRTDWALGKTGTLAGTNAELYKAVLAAHETELAAMIGRFTGASSKAEATVSGRIQPVAGTASYPLLESSSKGLKVLGGEFILPEKLRTTTSGAPPKVLSLELAMDPASTAVLATVKNAIARQESCCKNRLGLRYRVPARVVTRAKYGSDILYSGRSVVAQFGEVASLPDRVNLFGGQIALDFHAVSGAAKKLTVNSEALDPTLGRTAGTAITTAIGTSKKEDDELAALERKRKILEERDKIKTLEDKLKPPEPE